MKSIHQSCQVHNVPFVVRKFGALDVGGKKKRMSRE